MNSAIALQTFWGEDLKAIGSALMWLLEDATRARHSPLHTMTLATVDTDGFPEARTVVFRAFDASQRTVRFHTDLRSPKVSVLRTHPAVALHWYAAEWKLQLRMHGTATVHHQDEVARRAWEESHPRSRRIYSAPLPPGTPGDRPISDVDARFAAKGPDAENTASGFANFAAVAVAFHVIEWLVLASSGNRRGRLEWYAAADADPHSCWLAP